MNIQTITSTIAPAFQAEEHGHQVRIRTARGYLVGWYSAGAEELRVCLSVNLELEATEDAITSSEDAAAALLTEAAEEWSGWEVPGEVSRGEYALSGEPDHVGVCWDLELTRAVSTPEELLEAITFADAQETLLAFD